MAKLTVELVLEMRSKYASKLYTIGQLAKEYGVSINTASNAIHGFTWKEVDPMPVAVPEEAIAESQALLERMLQQQATAEPEVDLLEQVLKRRGGDDPLRRLVQETRSEPSAGQSSETPAVAGTEADASQEAQGQVPGDDQRST